ncbi:hypothetical protein DY000_02034740 [Brassica cretica]|uniref:glutathione transferase n=1 Tax=Brassica cretica TaxID=69181 RepID=A0ABQ7DYF4_BRACR|nr:hypothetical protein DY000_02034740 [Brassica cretica]
MAERSEEVKLLGMWASPFSRRVEIALTLKGVPYEFSEQDIANKSPLLLQSNPVHKMIPVLLHNGKPISESLVILEYIDETWQNNPILPQDPYDRAIARFWARFVDEQLMEKELVGKDFLGGESLGFVDIVATLVAFWLMRTEEVVGVKVVPVEMFPEIHRWVKNLLDIDVIKKCIPPEDEHLNYIRARMDSLKLKSV